MTKNEYIASIMLEAADLLKNDEEFDNLNEDIETMLVYNKLYRQKSVTLYHGSTKRYDTIIPNSINVGTRLSKERNSSYWSNDKGTSIVFGITNLLFGLNIKNYEYLYTKKDGKVMLAIEESDKDRAINALRTYKIYIHEIEIDPKTIGIGQAREVREFTIDKEVTPTKSYSVPYNELIKEIIFVPSLDDPKLQRMHKPKSRLIKKLVYHHDWLSRKSDIHYKSLSSIKKVQKLLKKSQMNLYETDILYHGVKILVNDISVYNIMCDKNNNLKEVMFNMFDALHKEIINNEPDTKVDTLVAYMMSPDHIKLIAYVYNYKKDTVDCFSTNIYSK